MFEDDSQESRRREDAARAAWLYFIGGRTQDEIAKQLNLSRQAIQRLVAQAVSERLVKFRIDHPFASCIELSAKLVERYSLIYCDVTPSDGTAPESVAGIAVAASRRINRLLAAKAPFVLGVGTGRTLRASVEYLDQLERPQHKILSLVGNMSSGGHASPHEVAMRIADKLGCQRYPMSLPVLTETPQERHSLQQQKSYVQAQKLYQQADATFLGIASIGSQSPLYVDGFINDGDLEELIAAGAIGEVIGWSFDRLGVCVDTSVNERVSSLNLALKPHRPATIVGCGPRKILPIHAALNGRLANALITDEATALGLLKLD